MPRPSSPGGRADSQDRMDQQDRPDDNRGGLKKNEHGRSPERIGQDSEVGFILDGPGSLSL